jgi:hypothetical protein
VRDLAARLTADFARNLDLKLSGNGESGPTQPAKSIDGLALVLNQLRLLVRKMLRRT